MPSYIKKIYTNKKTGDKIILASKNTNGPGHHLIELTENFEKLRVILSFKKIKISSLEETGMKAKIEKTKKNKKLDYIILKVFKY
tara:strand:+ start:314 stop:568 length:255 start_codon:yes stop_codon:yes gene_type:complete